MWTYIDGEAVDPAVVKKDYAISADGSSFKIDTYTYQRSR
jgi:hypothetical protein